MTPAPARFERQVHNDGLGACTLDFLRTHGEAEWQKPDALADVEEFKKSPAVAHCASLRELALAHARLV